MSGPHDPRQNHLLAALPAEERARLFFHLELVPMPLGEAVCEPGMTMRHVYFPTTSIVSLLYVMEDGASAEIVVVGNEGIVGVSLFMGGETTTSRRIAADWFGENNNPPGTPAGGIQNNMAIVKMALCV